MITLFLYLAALIGYGASQYCGPLCTKCATGMNCTECNPGHGPIGSIDCFGTCTISNCSACPKDVQTCTQCMQGYGFYNSSNACGACSPYCAVGCNQTGAGKCDKCDLGYGMASNGSCTPMTTNPRAVTTTIHTLAAAVTTTCTAKIISGQDMSPNSKITGQTGNPISGVTGISRNPNNGVTSILRNPNGGVTSISRNPNGGVTSISRNPNNGVTSRPISGNPNGRVTGTSGNPINGNSTGAAGSTIASVSAITIEPTYGPIAGGTVITIVTTWTHPNVLIAAVYIGSNLKADIKSQLSSANYSSSEIRSLVMSPPVSDVSPIDKPLQIMLEIYPDFVNVSTGMNFTYKPNATIYDINPKVIPLSGGIRLTVIGSNLASASNPVIRAVVVIWRNNSLSSRNESFGPCYQPNENGTQMTCLSPPIYIPQDFLLYLFGQTDQYSDVYRQRTRRDVFAIDWLKEHEAPLASRSRFKRSTDIFTNQTYVLPSTGDQMQVSMYADFDGLQVPLDNVRHLQVLNPPKLSCGNNIYFDSKASGTITIKGKYMNQYFRETDYIVRIGNGFCNVTGLTDNALTCEPPKDKPQQTDNDTLYCRDNFVLLVNVGGKTYEGCCLTYIDNGKTTFIIIIAVTVGSCLVIFVAIVVISICVRRSRTRKRPRTQEESIRNPLADRKRGAMMMLTSRQPNGIRSLKSYGMGSNDFSPDGYFNRIPRPEYTTRPTNYSSGYLHQDTIEEENDDIRSLPLQLYLPYSRNG